MRRDKFFPAAVIPGEVFRTEEICPGWLNPAENEKPFRQDGPLRPEAAGFHAFHIPKILTAIDIVQKPGTGPAGGIPGVLLIRPFCLLHSGFRRSL